MSYSAFKHSIISHYDQVDFQSPYCGLWGLSASALGYILKCLLCAPCSCSKMCPYPEAFTLLLPLLECCSLWLTAFLSHLHSCCYLTPSFSVKLFLTTLNNTTFIVCRSYVTFDLIRLLNASLTGFQVSRA